MVRMIIVDLEEQMLAQKFERAEVMLVIRVIAFVPIAELANDSA